MYPPPRYAGIQTDGVNRVAMQFETSSKTHAHLNGCFAVGIGGVCGIVVMI